MCLIHKCTTNIIVDIGSTKENNAGNIIVNFLKAKNIKDIDAICITHMHSDHINGIDTLIQKNININTICYTKPYKKVEEYINLRTIIKRNNIGNVEVVEGDNIKINNIEIRIISPPKNKCIKDDDMLNSNSTVYLISSNNLNLLFMGDSSKNTEKYILSSYIYGNKNLEIKKKLNDIFAYQVSHHGSNTSSYEEYIKNISIKNAIFSAQKSVYGHPNDSIVDLFRKYNYKIYLTEKDGAIEL